MTRLATDWPQIIFFDAGGTLLEVRGSVGEIYSRVAQDYGLAAEPEQLQQGFVRRFRAQPPLAFPPDLPAAELQARERAWWEQLVREVFAECEPFPRFGEFFAAVFDAFRREECWRLYDDVRPALLALQERGVRLAVLSNFDSRLDEILQMLGLAQFFEAVHISTRLGAAKPDPLIFHAALQQHGIAPQAAWHVGDAWREDVEGALAAGVRPVWLNRSGGLPDDERVTRILRLTELAGLLNP